MRIERMFCRNLTCETIKLWYIECVKHAKSKQLLPYYNLLSVILLDCDNAVKLQYACYKNFGEKFVDTGVDTSEAFPRR